MIWDTRTRTPPHTHKIPVRKKSCGNQNGISSDVESAEHNGRVEVVWSRRAAVITCAHSFSHMTALHLNASETYIKMGTLNISVLS